MRAVYRVYGDKISSVKEVYLHTPCMLDWARLCKAKGEWDVPIATIMGGPRTQNLSKHEVIAKFDSVC